MPTIWGKSNNTLADGVVVVASGASSTMSGEEMMDTSEEMATTTATKVQSGRKIRQEFADWKLEVPERNRRIEISEVELEASNK